MDEVSRNLARYVANCRFEDVPGPALQAAKRAVCDTIFAMVAGSSAPGIDVLLDFAGAWGGRGEARVIGTEWRLPAPKAAWCNGAMARALEIDDCVDFLPVHPSASAVPALLAIAELRRGLSGRDFLTALAVGQDVKIRFGLAVRENAMQSGRNNMFKIFGPTAAVARALRLDAEKTQQALGISFSHAVGDGQTALDGGLSLRLQQGIVAEGAVMSGLLAERGFTGARDFLFGKYGYLRAFEPNPNMPPLTDDLGRRFHGDLITVKPYSACRATHAAIDLALALRLKVGASVDAIKRIDIAVSPEVDRLVGAPREARLRPDSAAAAQFSLYHTVATALLRGRLFLEEIEPACYTDGAIRALGERVVVTGDPAMRTESVIGRTRLSATLADGRTLVFESTTPFGSPANPISVEGLAEKARRCAAYCRRKLRPDAVDRIAAAIDGLEAASDAATLLDPLFEAA